MKIPQENKQVLHSKGSFQAYKLRIQQKETSRRIRHQSVKTFQERQEMSITEIEVRGTSRTNYEEALESGDALGTEELQGLRGSRRNLEVRGNRRRRPPVRRDPPGHLPEAGLRALTPGYRRDRRGVPPPLSRGRARCRARLRIAGARVATEPPDAAPAVSKWTALSSRLCRRQVHALSQGLP